MSGPDFETDWDAPWWAWLLFAATILVYWLWGVIPFVRMAGVQMLGWGSWCIFTKQGTPEQCTRAALRVLRLLVGAVPKGIVTLCPRAATPQQALGLQNLRDST